MSPSDEKPPVAGMPPFAGVSNNGPAAPLKNPLHEMYAQSKPTDVAASASASADVGAYGPAAGAGSSIPQPTPGGQPPLQAAAAQRPAVNPEPSTADEQVWVEKTKAAITQTQNDPYRRVQVLQELRAAYQAARFNKHSDGTAGS